MAQTPTLKAAVAGLTMLAAGSVYGQSMGTQLKVPQEVPLDFLVWIDKDAGWLRDQLVSLGVATPPTFRGQRLETSDLDALKAVNRIRAFAFLAAKGLWPPYFDLTLDTPTGPLRCLTEFPRSVVPGLGPMDFDKPSFPVSAANPEILKTCTVPQAQNAPYDTEDRDTFREKYFDGYGVLKNDFQTLDGDVGFMARAVDLGFFLGVEDYSGVLRVDLQ